MNKHTPGPWVFDPENTGNVFEVCAGIISEPDKDSFLARPTVANVPIGSEHYEADARLVAAAPQLLEACKALLTVMDSGGQPRKLDEALTWRQNDEKARRLAIEAIAAAEEDP